MKNQKSKIKNQNYLPMTDLLKGGGLKFKIIKKLVNFDDGGFTLMEFLIVAAIVALIGGIIMVSILSFREQADLSVATQNVIDKLRAARGQTIASKLADSWGIHLESSAAILFKGPIYNLLDSGNEIYNLPSIIEIANCSFGLPADIIFNRITGNTQNYGVFDIRLKTNTAKFQTVKIESNGQASVSETPLSPLGTRVFDWRHTHFVYERAIDINSEILTLMISGSGIINLPIRDYLDADNHFDWSGTVSVGADDQIWAIHTHYLNDISDKTVFSVYRGQNNNKAAVLAISGESGVNLVNYDASGAAIKGTSIYALAPTAR